MPELLFELGCEELPATAVRRAYSDLLRGLTELFQEAGVLLSPGQAYGTPRRLIVSFPDLKETQPDVTKEQRGPALKSAFNAEGAPTPALLGFCRSQGIDVESLRRDDQYVWVTKTGTGRPTVELLAELLPKAVRALTFDKTMRWGASRMRFARPIRWILAVFNGQTVAFHIEGVPSGNESRGHRFYSPEPFAVSTLDELLPALRQRKVEPDAAIRRQLILTQAAAVANGQPDLPDALVEENTFLTEWPTAIQGAFRDEFLNLPAPVLVTAMAKHEKMFPIRDADGKITKNFVFIRNSGEDDSVRKGCEWVLNARFNDAKFFFDEDAKHTMDDFLAKTATIVFQDKLGTVRQRADRLAPLALTIAAYSGGDQAEVEAAAAAGLYAKADLSSGLVGELTSLQGVIGGEYARRQGFSESVVWAIATQYDPSQNASPDNANVRTAVRLIMADQIDKLAGYLGLGLEPTGSSDPYGLRRAANILIEAAWNWPSPLPSYEVLFESAIGRYASQGVELNLEQAQTMVRNVFASRYPALLPEVRYDVLEAAMADPSSAEPLRPRMVKLRCTILSELFADAAFVQTATRPLNIVNAARKKNLEFGTGDRRHDINFVDLDSEDGNILLETLVQQMGPLEDAVKCEDSSAIVGYLRRLADPINRFFENTMVMADQPEVRFARLTLMNACAHQLLTAGDFSKAAM